MLWLGAIDAAQEVVKERAVLERERAVGVKLRAYLASKLIVLFGLVTVQTVLYAGLLLALRPLDADFGAWVSVFALLVATGCVAVCMGLAISAISGTPDQAMSFVPLAVIPQLLFAGAIVPVEGMAEPAQTISYGIFAQWWLAASGTAVDMNARIAESPRPRGRGVFRDRLLRRRVAHRDGGAAGLRAPLPRRLLARPQRAASVSSANSSAR